MKPIRLAFALLCAPALWLMPASAMAFDHAKVAEASLTQHIRPGYARLESAFNGLAQALEGYCAAPEPASSDAVYAGFKAAVRAWGRVEHIRFGPVADDNRFERIAFWPDAKSLGRKQVLKVLRRKDKTVLAPSSLSRKSVALQGLTALEVMLYSKRHERRFGPNGPGAFACAYSRSVAANLIAIAGAVRSGWGEGGQYARLWRTPGADNPLYFTGKEVIQELVQAYTTALEQTRDKKLLFPMGKGAGRTVPSRPPFERSRLSLAILIANLEGLDGLFVDGGFLDAVNAFREGQGRTIADVFHISLKRLRKLEAEPWQAFSNPERIAQLTPVVFLLGDAVEQGGPMMREAADLSIGFNASDGD